MVPDPASLVERRPSAAAVRAAASAAREWLVAHPPAVAAGLTLLGLLAAAVQLFASLPAGTWPWLGDSVIFEYVGWFLTEGNRLYVDVWEVKPPLPFEVTALLALLAGENVVLYHVLNLVANTLAIAAGAAAAAAIVHDLTDDAAGAVAAGVAPFVFPTYFYRALVGFKPKYLVVAAGLGALALAYRDRPVAAGVAGAVAVGCWQFAAVVPCCVLVLCWQRGGRRGAGRAALGGLVTAVVVLLPVVAWGAVPAMVTEVVLVGLLTPEGEPLLVRALTLGWALGVWLPLALVGTLGIAWSTTRDRLARRWPLVVLAGWFTLQLLALDYDNTPDLFPWLAVLSVGVGLAVPDLRRLQPAWLARQVPVGPHAVARAVAAGVLVLATVSVATMGGYGVAPGWEPGVTFDTDRELSLNTSSPDDLDGVERQYVYWNRIEIATCRAFGAANQQRLVRRLDLAENRRWETAPCGRFDPVWDAVRERYGLP